MDTPLLTTITPVWNRESMLRIWLKCVHAASIPEVRHIVFFVGEEVPAWFLQHDRILCVQCPERPGKSIAHYHNEGAHLAKTPWIMKLDVDCIMNSRYYRELAPILRGAKPREWFNGGMLMISRHSSEAALAPEQMPMTDTTYTRMILNARAHSANSYAQPEATNFICRRDEYILLGGADARFAQYGWEDYQQIYMLEKHQRGKDPLPGIVDLSNVTQRCRDEISRPKARELFNRNRWLCLFHRWHPVNTNVSYRSPDIFYKNRQVLLDYINKAKANAT
jgi:hypothetical protein